MILGDYFIGIGGGIHTSYCNSISYYERIYRAFCPFASFIFREGELECGRWAGIWIWNHSDKATKQQLLMCYCFVVD